MEFSKEQKKNAYMNLSEAQKDFISADSTVETYTTIAEGNGLLLDKAGEISDIVFLFLLGLIRSTEVYDQLKNKLVVSDTVCQKITAALNERVFLPFRSLAEQESRPETEAPEY